MKPDEHPTSNIQRRTSNGSANPRSLRRSVFDVGCWMLDVGCSMFSLGSGGSTSDFSSALSRFEQALMLDERGDLKAAELYRKAIEEQDCVADAYCNLGIIESQKGNTAKAFDCFTTSLKYNPRHSEAHYNLGNLYCDVNDFRLAQIHYEMAKEVDPSFANVYFNLALVQAINNDLGAAVSALTRYQELVSKDEAGNAE